MTTLDFRKTKKNYLKVTLPDEAETSFSVLQPTKELFHKMVAMSEEVGSISGSDLDALDEVYGVCAELMSRNKEGLVVSKSNLERSLDFETSSRFCAPTARSWARWSTEKTSHPLLPGRGEGAALRDHLLLGEAHGRLPPRVRSGRGAPRLPGLPAVSARCVHQPPALEGNPPLWRSSR